ncbi:MAG: lipid A biosynthesis acyltransferase [Wenzhouxiangellaceae bacterium]|nr:lipid A biosynthesis acyltransferase [Wenzhouxiangellaceae bacterium]
MGKLTTIGSRAALVPLRWIGRLPVDRARRATGWLGRPMQYLMRRRAAIVARNLELCLPELDLAARKRLAHDHFKNLAESLGEISCAWSLDAPLGPAVGRVEGLEHLAAARAGGQGVLLLTGHSTCLELGARVFGEQVDSCAIYRPLRNPVLEDFQNRGRARYARRMIARDHLREMVRFLRAGGVLWYAPDQDFGVRRSLFAPFFGVPAATAKGMLELARLGRARVVPMYPHKDETSGTITVVVEPAFENFPSDQPVADLTRYNEFLERNIRRSPAQYWWLHRRFKTRPAGHADRYALQHRRRP